MKKFVVLWSILDFVCLFICVNSFLWMKSFAERVVYEAGELRGGINPIWNYFVLGFLIGAAVFLVLGTVVTMKLISSIKKVRIDKKTKTLKNV